MKLKHRMWQTVSVFGLVGTFTVGALLPSSSSFAQGTPDGDLQGSISPPPNSGLQAAKAPHLWSREEMLGAKPYEVAVPQTAHVGTEQSNLRIAADATPGFDVGGSPTNAQATLEKVPEMTADVTKLAADLQSVAGPYSYPAPYTRYEVFTGLADPNTYTVWPYTTIGKLFFRQYGVAYVCSAASVGNRAIVTAGHCIHAGNNRRSGWSTDLVFVPAYKDGVAPLGQWPAQNQNLRVMRAWYRNGNPQGLRRDVGGAILNQNQNGQTLSQVVGWLGFAWNWGYTQHYNAFGFPQAAPFTGQRLIDCQGSYAYYSTDEGPSGAPLPRAIGCDMTGGSSGGPWVWQFGTGNYLNGVNSFKRNGFDQEMFAPYFDTAIKNMKDCLVNENC
jgi:V8-like Glu-specific endopeptidase